jgi:uncharacterized protein
MTFHTTAIYAAILGLLAFVLSAMVTAKRAQHKQSLDAGGHPDLNLAIRRHGNLTEYLPLFLILLGLCEVRGMPALWLNVLGIIFTLARLAHVFGLDPSNVTGPRGIGVIGTHLTMLAAIVYLAWSLFAQP